MGCENLQTFILSSQKERGRPIEALGARGRSSTHTLHSHPSIPPPQVKGPARERVVQERGGVGGLGPAKSRKGGDVKVLSGDDHIRALPLLGAGGQLLAQGLL